MGLLRVILALAVVAAHVGPLFGLRFFGGGVMAVETFYMLSGFYMALVLATRYRGRTRDFYFNRFLRLFPVYWLLAGAFFVYSALYWLAIGHPLGALAAWQSSPHPLHWLWATIANVGIVGSDWAELYAYATADGNSVNRLVAIQPVWSLAVEITFYLAAPFVLRRSIVTQAVVFLATLLVRVGIWLVTGGHWTIWIYYFAPATWVFFMAGVLAYHLMVWLKKGAWFAPAAHHAGRALAGLLALLIIFYAQIDLLRFQDWRYYVAVGLALPFIFTAFETSPGDSALAAWSYPIYLAHAVIIGISPPFRHFVSSSLRAYVILFLTLVLCFIVLRLDKRIQLRFKHRV